MWSHPCWMHSALNPALRGKISFAHTIAHSLPGGLLSKLHQYPQERRRSNGHDAIWGISATHSAVTIRRETQNRCHPYGRKPPFRLPEAGLPADSPATALGRPLRQLSSTPGLQPYEQLRLWALDSSPRTLDFRPETPDFRVPEHGIWACVCWQGQSPG
jgi:hypothetical protein